MHVCMCYLIASYRRICLMYVFPALYVNVFPIFPTGPLYMSCTWPLQVLYRASTGLLQAFHRRSTAQRLYNSYKSSRW